MERINLLDAWNTTTGSSNVSVGIIDSGIAQDFRLEHNLNTRLSANFVSTEPNASPYYDKHGHGTAVASIVGAVAKTENDMVGICQNVDLISLRAWGENAKFIDINDVIAAIEYATENHINILNLSLNITSYSPELEAAIQAYDGLIVIAAGNENQYLNGWSYYPYQYVQNCDNLLIVGESASDYRKSSQSNYSNTDVDLFAPSYGICAISSTIDNTPNHYKLVKANGTSFAAPEVAATAALLLSAHPDYTVAQLKHIINSSVEKLTSLTSMCKSDGCLDSAAAVNYILGDINGDGVVSNSDLIAVSRYIVGSTTFDEDEFNHADFNGDGVINNSDLVSIAALISRTTGISVNQLLSRALTLALQDREVM